MFPQSYFPATYFPSAYFPKVGALGAVATGSSNQLLPMLGIGCWLLAMFLT